MREWRFRTPGRVRVRDVGALREGDDPHLLALRLGAPALLDPCEPGAGEAIVPLAARGTLKSREGSGTLEWDGAQLPAPGRGLDALRRLLRAVACERPDDTSLPFAGGLVVMLAYDLAHEIERLPRTTEDRDGLPWLHAVASPAAALVDLATRRVRLAWIPEEGREGLRWGLDAAEAEDVAVRLGEALRSQAPIAHEGAGGPSGDVRRLVTAEEHARRVDRLLRELRDGEIYQANLSQRYEVPWWGSALALHAVLRLANPSPMSGWLRAPGFELVSNSPERLVRLRGRELVSEPIAGTAPLPAGPSTSSADAAVLRDRLAASAKDHAEHVMIVDIHRNDVGRASAPGTLRVESMMRIDRRSHVLQAIADIRGTLREGADAVDVVEAMFPGGCVTGVPKIRCMEILDAVERAGRGPYTGSFGSVTAWGDLDLNVLIRSAWRAGGRLAFAAGGGIVLDSDPVAEWTECEAKAGALLDGVEALRRDKLHARSPA